MDFSRDHLAWPDLEPATLRSRQATGDQSSFESYEMPRGCRNTLSRGQRLEATQRGIFSVHLRVCYLFREAMALATPDQAPDPKPGDVVAFEETTQFPAEEMVIIDGGVEEVRRRSGFRCFAQVVVPEG